MEEINRRTCSLYELASHRSNKELLETTISNHISWFSDFIEKINYSGQLEQDENRGEKHGFVNNAYPSLLEAEIFIDAIKQVLPFLADFEASDSSVSDLNQRIDLIYYKCIDNVATVYGKRLEKNCYRKCRELLHVIQSEQPSAEPAQLLRLGGRVLDEFTTFLTEKIIEMDSIYSHWRENDLWTKKSQVIIDGFLGEIQARLIDNITDSSLRESRRGLNRRAQSLSSVLQRSCI